MVERLRHRADDLEPSDKPGETAVSDLIRAAFQREADGECRQQADRQSVG
jgi:hypothetical protein